MVFEECSEPTTTLDMSECKGVCVLALVATTNTYSTESNTDRSRLYTYSYVLVHPNIHISIYDVHDGRLYDRMCSLRSFFFLFFQNKVLHYYYLNAACQTIQPHIMKNNNDFINNHQHRMDQHHNSAESFALATTSTIGILWCPPSFRDTHTQPWFDTFRDHHT